MKKRNLLLTVLSTSVFTSCMIGCSNSNHTITFNTDGGSEIASQSVKHNALAIEPNDPVKLPYGFTGWYTDKDHTNAFDFTQPITQNLTLYAKWSNSVEFTYLYHSSEGVNTIAFESLAITEDPITKVKIPLIVDWGDDETETYTNDDDLPENNQFVHTYKKGESGKTTYKVTILGLIVSLSFIDEREGCHYVQSIDINGLPYADISCDLKLGSTNQKKEPSQVSKITLPRNLSFIPGETFTNTSIKEFTIGKQVSTIRIRAFNKLIALESIDFSKAVSLRSIKGGAFSSCTKLNNVVFPENLAAIGQDAFSGCSKLTTITFTSKMPAYLVGDTCPFDTNTLKTIYIPKGCKSVYVSHWGEDYPLLVKKLVEIE